MRVGRLRNVSFKEIKIKRRCFSFELLIIFLNMDIVNIIKDKVLREVANRIWNEIVDYLSIVTH